MSFPMILSNSNPTAGMPMTASELKQLIEADATALASANADQWRACAERASQIAPPVRVPIPAQAVLRSAALDGSLAKITLAARESSAAPDTIKGACVTFLRWMDHEWPMDIDLPTVQTMMAGMIAAGLVTQAQATALSALANQPQTFTALECRFAMRGF